MRNAIAALALAFLAVHLPFLPPTLDDIDSINFALGVADFDVAKHQPHPPGYPVFIALGKASTSLFQAAGVPSSEPRALAVWSTLGGAGLAFVLFALFRGVGSIGPVLLNPRVAWWTTLVTLTSPLFWFTALRPLSDTTGLAAAVAAQALIVSVIAGLSGPRALVWGGFVAGLAIGVRSQTFLMTLPLLALALLLSRMGLRPRDRIATLGATAVGVLVWAVPLIVASGGLASYVTALGTQAGEDFSGVVMLWTTRRPRIVLDALMYSFVWPWGYPCVGYVFVVLAAAGAMRLLWAIPRAAGLLAVAYLPYAVFHLLFHEVITVRYALPLVAPMAFVAVYALEAIPAVVARLVVVAAVVSSLVLSVPATIEYGRRPSPAFGAFAEAVGGGEAGRPHVIAFHAVARRAVDWLRAADMKRPAGSPALLPDRVLSAPHGREWLTLIEQWRADPTSRISFVADPRRTDLALIDPASHRAPLIYRWPFSEAPFVGGTRPGDSDLYTLNPPGWMLDEGWALTAEIAGVTAKDGFGPHRKPAVAWVRSRREDAMLLLGGRHLGSPADPAVEISLALNGQRREVFTVNSGYFFRLIPLAAGALAGPAGAYVPLTVSAKPATGSTAVIPVGLEQFDLQGPGAPMVGAEAGWYEPEYDPRTAKSWRWLSDKGTLWVRPIGRDVTLRLAGESPLKYYDTPAVITVNIGDREIDRFTAGADFTREVRLAADALSAADGKVVIACDKSFVPAERDGSPDRRRLAVRIYSYRVD